MNRPANSGDADGLRGLARAAGNVAARPAPPVERWNPPMCDDIGLRIDRNGVWFHQGDPIGRPELTRLFSTILRRDPDGYVLVTPVEKVPVAVEDVPFLAVELEAVGQGDAQALRFRTNVGDWTTADAERPLRFEKDAHDGLKPYVKVRGELWARLTRPLLHQLVELGEIREIAGRRIFGAVSMREFFAIAPAEELEEFS